MLIKVLIVDEYKPTYILLNLFFREVKKDKGLDIEIDWINSYQKAYQSILKNNYNIVISEINLQHPLEKNAAIVQKQKRPDKLAVIFTTNEIAVIRRKYPKIDALQVPILSKANFITLKKILGKELNKLANNTN